MKVGIFLFNKRIAKYSLYFLVAFTAILGTIFIARSAYATIAINDTVKNNAISYTSYVSLSGCARYKLKSSIQTDASNPKSTDPSSWYGPDINGGNSYVYPSGKNTECGDIMKNVSSLWGISDYGKFLRDVGYTFDESVPEYKWNGSDDERRDAFSKQIASKTVNGIRADTLTDATKYAIYASSLDGDCKGTDVGPYTSTYKSYADSGRRDGDYIFAKVVTSGGDRVYKRLYGGEMTVYGYVASNFQTGSSVRSVKCSTINDTVNATAAAYLKEEAKGLCQTSGPKYTEAKLINACANGAANKGSGLMFCVNSYKGYYSGGSGSNQKDERDACFVGQGNGGGGQCVDIGYNTDTTLQACINGIKNSSNTSYCNSTYPAPDNLNSSGSLPNDTNAEKRKACTDGQGLKVTANPIDTPVTNPSSEDPNLTSSCVVEGIGWIICPVTKFLADISDSSFSVISNFLMVNVKLLDTNSGTYTAWSTFRSIANVAFVIVFLIIIFSQLTGQGVSNYGIKKTLPRLIVAAILVNISFYVCQLAVDLTQIIGVGIKQLLENIPVGSASTEGPGSWTNVMGDILMGTTVLVGVIGATAAAVAIAGLSISLPVLLAVLLAVLMTVIILMARQAGIVILIILSPLAFVAYLLPNTEQWFKRWYKVFLALLMVFPTVALLYGGGALTSKILSNVANSPGIDASSKFWISLTALAVASLPLIMTPSLLRGALNGIGSMGAKISGIAAKANGRIRGSANSTSRYGEAKQGIKNRFALGRATRRGRSDFQQSIDNSRVGRMIGLDKGAARAVNTLAREDEEGVDAAVVQFKSRTNSVERLDKAEELLRESIKSGNTTQARAAQKILLGSGNKGLEKIQGVYSDSAMQQHLTQPHANGTMDELRNDLNNAGLKGKNNALATYGFSGGHDSFNTHLGASSTYAGLNPVELAGQSAANLGANQQAITPSMAKSVLENDQAQALLDGAKRQIFEARARQGGGQQGQTPTPQANPTPTTTQNPTLQVPHSQPNGAQQPNNNQPPTPPSTP